MVDATHVYWSAAHATGPAGRGSPLRYSQARVPSGGGVTLFACQEAGGIAVDSTNVYLGTATTVLRLPK